MIYTDTFNNLTPDEVRSWLISHADNKYKTFSSTLIPGSKPILGIRIPQLRSIAKQIAAGDWRLYLRNAYKDYYEELCIQGFVIGYAKADIEEILEYVACFVPKIGDWSVNDGFCTTLKIAKKYPKEVWDFLNQYKESNEEFELRFLAVMAMSHFTNEVYIDRVLELYDSIHHKGYYVKMGVAWGIATAFAKFPSKTMKFLQNNHIDDATYNKAIQKMLESYRISDENKVQLRRMKRS